tara:strand:+ start:6640 stop:7422 length:783 start_codon:yes stop_codon:yes gene_type:complete
MCIGYVKLHRQLEHWGWYQDSKALHLFIHLLIKASTTNRIYKGVKLKKGQLITSYRLLAEQTGISLQSVRTILTKLESTHEIQVQNNQKFTIVTVKKWESYQASAEDEQLTDDTDLTQEQHATNTVATQTQHTTNTELTPVKEVKNVKNDVKKINKKESFINSVEFQYQEPLASWLNYRKDLKTLSQWQYQYKQLSKFNNPQEVVEHSIGQGYRGLFEPKPISISNNKQGTFEAMKEVDCMIEQSGFGDVRPPSAYLQGE